MSNLTIELYNTEIPDSDIKKYPKSMEKISYGSNQRLQAGTLDILLDNTSSEYDDRTAGSLFFGSAWVNQPATIFDNDLEYYIWKGRIKNIKVNDRDRTVTVKTSNYISDASKIPCIKSVSSNVTAAESIYDILIDLVGVEVEDIDYSGFQKAISIQTANSVYVNIDFVEADNKNCLSVISELCRMTQCHLYLIDNRFKFFQYEEWGGQLGFHILDHNLISKQYQHEFDEKIVFNSYSVKYDNASAIAIITGSDSVSQTKYGKRIFIVPNESLDSTTSNDYKLLFRDVTGATWAGDLAITRFQDMRKIFQITVGKELDFLELNEQVDLSLESMIKEPGQIIEKQYDKDKGEIKLKGYFLNTPYQYYARDTSPPDPVELIAVESWADGGIRLQWTISNEADHVGYWIYFTSTKGEWWIEDCNKGQSPINVKNPTVNSDGYNELNIRQLNEGTTYFFKITSYDTSFNESQDSNIIELIHLPLGPGAIAQYGFSLYGFGTYA